MNTCVVCGREIEVGSKKCQNCKANTINRTMNRLKNKTIDVVKTSAEKTVELSVSTKDYVTKEVKNIDHKRTLNSLNRQKKKLEKIEEKINKKLDESTQIDED